MTPAILLVIGACLAIVWVALLYDYAQHADPEVNEVFVNTDDD